MKIKIIKREKKWWKDMIKEWKKKENEREEKKAKYEKTNK